MNKEHLENDILYNAMVSASSLWRRHGQTDIRSKNPATQANTSNELNNYPDNGKILIYLFFFHWH